jgi:hydroxyacyl-ACP dehydratase HTD2-like protein with hotdog domain
LTFNAHSIHLDRSYARDVEGYDDVLVHGPLTLTLTLTVMQRHLSKLGKNISGIEYRNLAPLIVEQPLRICAKPKDAGRGTSWEVWVERGDGGLAVRGTIETKDQ